MATLICRSFWINQCKCLQDYYNFPSNGSCPLTRKEIFISLQWACWFQKKLNSSIPTKQIQSNHQGPAMLSSLLKPGKQQGLQMPPAKGFWYSAHLWDCIPCFFHVWWVFLILQFSYSSFVSFSTLEGQYRVNNLKFLFKKEAGGFIFYLCSIFSG